MTDSKLTTTQKLNLETAKLNWKELEMIFAQGRLLCVGVDKDLVAVASYVADDDQAQIEKLILQKDIEFASPTWVKENCRNMPELWAVVIPPYVICQLIEG